MAEAFLIYIKIYLLIKYIFFKIYVKSLLFNFGEEKVNNNKLTNIDLRK